MGPIIWAIVGLTHLIVFGIGVRLGARLPEDSNREPSALSEENSREVFSNTTEVRQ